LGFYYFNPKSNINIQPLPLSKRFSFIAKALLTILFTWLIYRQVTTQGDFISGSGDLRSLTFNYWMLALAIIGMPINWLLEAYKWRQLCKPYTSLSLYQAIKSILAGLTLGIITPARIGEYGGRLLMTPGASRAGIVTATFVGSISQNLWNISVGLLLSLPLLKHLATSGVEINESMLRLFGLFQVLVLLIIYFNIGIIASWTKSIKLPFSLRSKLDRLGEVYSYSSIDLLKVLSISALRYLFYFIQYGCLMIALNVDLSLGEILSSVGAIYLIQSMVPIPSYLSILARGELSILIWGIHGVEPLKAVVATFTLWTINLIVPSIFGVYLLIKADFWSRKFSK
jgi:hypothetical protein